MIRNQVPTSLAGDSKSRNRGFSLIELMVALLLGVFLIGAVVFTYLTSRSAASDAEQLSRMQENVRFAVEYLIRDLRNAGFADDLDSTVWAWSFVRGAFATIETDGNGRQTLVVRYLGRGHCTQAFNQFEVVQNAYSVDPVTRQLVCRGQHASAPTNEGDPVSFDDGGTVSLLPGVRAIQFNPICPAGVDQADCQCQHDASDESVSRSCIGMRVQLDLEGLRAGAEFDTRSIAFQAAFRNVVLERIKRDIHAAPPPAEPPT